ncbi:MAG: hypothetical protein HY319_30170 [Armatimonadetes bacterium]|nr:hypothetical protein [Armatimonadota bacterium]
MLGDILRNLDIGSLSRGVSGIVDAAKSGKKDSIISASVSVLQLLQQAARTAKGGA